MSEQAAQVSLTIGDHVRLKARDANEYQSYRVSSSQVAFMREPVDGLVLSIRNVSTGKLVPETTGALTNYVVELVFDNTFSPKYASTRNAARGVERVTANPAWRRLRAVLRDMTSKGQLLTSSSPEFLQESPLTKMLDGWKVVKVFSQELLSLEKPDQEQEAAE